MKKLLSLSAFLGSALFLATKAIAAVDTITIVQPDVVPNTNVGSIIGAVVGLLLIIAAIAAFLFLIIGGIQWITSGGDKAGMEAARNRITSAIVGLIIVAAAWAVMTLLGQFTGITLMEGLKIPSIEDVGPTPQG